MRNNKKKQVLWCW